MQKIAIPCVILAGGRSSRLGKDKTQIPLGGYSLSQWVFMRLREISDDVYISTKQRDKFCFDAPFLVEKDPIYAPIVGMINAFNTLKAQELLFISVDTPFITAHTLHKIATSSAAIAYAKSTDKAHYLISKWHISLLDALLWAYKSKMYALHRIIESHPSEGITATDEECFNINTMTDYTQALRVLETLQNKG